MPTPRRRWQGWSGFCVALLSWSGRVSTPRVLGRLDKCLGWALTWPRTRCGTCFRTRFRSMGRRRSEPAGLLRSVEQLLRRVTTTPGAGTGLHVLPAQVADLVWEANTGVGG
jgi:hypothetical protein